MFTVFGRKHRHCDGISRRDFLTAGVMGIGGVTLADLRRIEAAAGITNSRKAVINIHLDGGPPQMDTIDLKPNAPSEIRGEFSPISTRLPEFQITELMPQMAAMADRFVFLRSLVGAEGRHDAFQCQTGFSMNDLQSIGGRPAMGSMITKILGGATDVAPSFVDLMQGRPLVRDSARAGFLGPAYKPFRPDISRWFKRPLEDGMKKELAAQGSNHATSLSINTSISAERLQNRAQLLGGLDRLRRDVDSSNMMDALDTFNQQAATILLSGKFAAAMDLESEDPKILKRYTPVISKTKKFSTAEDHFSMRKFLLARRLIEAGVRCVSVSFSDFDTHSSNFSRMRHMLPILDHGLCALVSDLEERGMLDDVSIVAWGEFGRTPKINANGGRDHWPRVAPAIMAGGGIRAGQVIGATDRTAGDVIARPIHYQDVMATLYHNMGIDAASTTVVDPSGRPQYLLDRGQRIGELV
ncbi:DUF1501 domain-containing protein [Pirellulaceae bacterium]|jgi:hypothetical protein|nr:DUF1501 domain-containing protein [Pirellulaceae bacterium]